VNDLQLEGCSFPTILGGGVYLNLLRSISVPFLLFVFFVKVKFSQFFVFYNFV
jgi:hypothetical protein